MNQYDMQRQMLDEMRKQQEAQMLAQMAAQYQAPQMPAPTVSVEKPSISMPIAQPSGFSPQQGMAAFQALRSEPMQVPQMNVSGPNVIPITPVQLDDDQLGGLLMMLSKFSG